MKSLHKITFLLIYVVITLLWLLYDRRNILSRQTIGEILLPPAIWVLPILMFGLGFLLSLPYSYLKDTKHKNFFWGHSTCMACMFMFFMYTFIADWQHDKKFGNFENNRANRANTFFANDKVYQVKAYDALESNFADKNSFRITDLFSDNFDTSLNSIPTKIHISWFEYYSMTEPTRSLCAKYYVFNDTVVTEYFNEEVIQNSDFKKRKAFKDSLTNLMEELIR